MVREIWWWIVLSGSSPPHLFQRSEQDFGLCCGGCAWSTGICQSLALSLNPRLGAVSDSGVQSLHTCLQSLMDRLGCRAMLSWQCRHGSVPCPYKQGWSHPLHLWEYGDTNKLTAFKLPDGHGNGSKAGNIGKHYIQLSQNKILQLFLSLETFCFYSIAFNDAKKTPFLFQTIQCFPHLHFFQCIDVSRITVKSPNRRCPCSLVLETAMKYWNVLKGWK